ncbi:MAG TPA: hypothetical protein VFA07_19890 [Chthonomonadaceae bacterium]|nr:hypothetical protein [Chthonomonadaceae bacterium]
MESALPVTAKTILAEATVAEDGSLHLTDPTALAFKPGEKVLLAISPIANGKRENKEPLLGTVTRYDDPFGPATSPEDWEALRGC